MNNNSQCSIETSAPQQPGGFIVKPYLEIQLLPRADKKGFALAH